MATKKAKAAKAAPAAKPRALCPVALEEVTALRVRAGGESHSTTALQFRVDALEKLVAALIDAR